MEDLDTRVRAALEEHRGDWPRIAEDAEVSYSWLSKFVNGHIPSPRLDTLRRVSQAIAARRSPDTQGA